MKSIKKKWVFLPFVLVFLLFLIFGFYMQFRDMKKVEMRQVNYAPYVGLMEGTSRTRDNEEQFFNNVEESLIWFYANENIDPKMKVNPEQEIICFESNDYKISVFPTRDIFATRQYVLISFALRDGLVSNPLVYANRNLDVTQYQPDAIYTNADIVCKYIFDSYDLRMITGEISGTPILFGICNSASIRSLTIQDEAPDDIVEFIYAIDNFNEQYYFWYYTQADFIEQIDGLREEDEFTFEDVALLFNIHIDA